MSASSPRPLTIQSALDRYGAVVGQAKRTQHLAIVQKYLLWGGTNTDAKLAEYAAYLSAADYKTSTIDLHLRIIRAFWRALGLSVPRTPPGMLVTSERVALAAEQIHELIHAVRQHGRPYEQALLALSTVYGLRAVELARMRRQDIRSADARLFVRTAKGGVQRWHWLPETLQEYLDIVWPRTTANHLAKVWHNIIVYVECSWPKGVGWHGIRRALVRDLAQAQVSDAQIAAFMRWATGPQLGKQSMVEIYAHPTAETLHGLMIPTAAQEGGARMADEAVWTAHPYLADWS